MARWLAHTGEESAGLENVGRLVGATAVRNTLLWVALMPCASAGPLRSSCGTHRSAAAGPGVGGGVHGAGGGVRGGGGAAGGPAAGAPLTDETDGDRRRGVRRSPSIFVSGAARSAAAGARADGTALAEVAEEVAHALLDDVRAEAHRRGFSRHTANAYARWVRRFVLHHDKRHPAELGTDEVRAFLVSLALEEKLAASSRNQALSALKFLYRDVLREAPEGLDELERARGRARCRWCCRARR